MIITEIMITRGKALSQVNGTIPEAMMMKKACTVTAIGIQMIPGTVMTPTGIPTGDIKRLIICN